MEQLKQVQELIKALPEGLKGKVSDGYHTFDELYEFRHALYINVALTNKDKAIRTLKNKEGESWDGWFILAINTHFGQISFHLPMSKWDLTEGVTEIERNFNYDGHNSEDVLDRLVKLLR